MKIATSKWLLILIYLMISLPLSVFVAVVATQLSITLFLFLFYGQQIDLSTIDFLKLLKGSIAGGTIGAVGCWWVYYQRYRKNASDRKTPIQRQGCCGQQCYCTCSQRWFNGRQYLCKNSDLPQYTH